MTRRAAAALLVVAALTAALLAGTERESDAQQNIAVNFVRVVLPERTEAIVAVSWTGREAVELEVGLFTSTSTKVTSCTGTAFRTGGTPVTPGTGPILGGCSLEGLSSGVPYAVDFRLADGTSNWFDAAHQFAVCFSSEPGLSSDHGSVHRFVFFSDWTGCPTAPPPTTVPPPTTAPPGPVSVERRSPPTTTLPLVVFEDVAPDAPYHGHVQDIARRGVTAGCGTEPPRFCPDEPVTRAQMAVFLSRALGLPDPPSGLRSFADVGSGHFAAGAVEAVRIAGITAGCATGPLRFCPADQTSLAQMATFLRRAFAFASAIPQGFVDTRGSVHEADIDALRRAGIMDACGAEPLRFCPDEPVTRAQMATFLSRALRCVERGPQLQEGAQPMRTCPRPGRNP